MPAPGAVSEPRSDPQSDPRSDRQSDPQSDRLSDPLSDALADLRVAETSVARVSLRRPWGYRLPGDVRWGLVAVVAGECWLSVDGTGNTGDTDGVSGVGGGDGVDEVRLGAGDLVVVQRPRQRGLALRSPAGAAVLDTARALEVGALHRVARRDGSAATVTDGLPGGEQSVLLAAGYRMRSSRSDLLLDQLPAVMHLPHEAAPAGVRATVALLAEEAEQADPGAPAVLGRLGEVLLIQAMRTWSGGSCGQGQRCWLAALDDRELSSALAAMHADSGADWTVTTLAARAGLSRAHFAHRFTRATGWTPAAYLTRLRMTHASRLLEDTSDTVSAIATGVGYRSTAAFIRTFTRIVGSTPTQHRHTHQHTGARRTGSQRATDQRVDAASADAR